MYIKYRKENIKKTEQQETRKEKKIFGQRFFGCGFRCFREKKENSFPSSTVMLLSFTPFSLSSQWQFMLKCSQVHFASLSWTVKEVTLVALFQHSHPMSFLK